MPRVSEIEKAIIDMMDECLISLVRLNAAGPDLIQEIQALNELIEIEIYELFPQLKRGSELYAVVRISTIGLCLMKRLGEKLQAPRIHVFWLAQGTCFNVLPEQSVDKIIDLSNKLTSKVHAWDKIISISERGHEMRLMNLVDEIVGPIQILSDVISQDFIGLSRSRKSEKRISQGFEVELKAAYEREYQNIASQVLAQYLKKCLVINSDIKLVEIDGKKINGMSALFFNNLQEMNTDEIKNEKIRMLDLVESIFERPSIHIWGDNFDYKETIKFICPKKRYKRKIINHKGQIIGLYAAMIVDINYRTSNSTVKESIDKVSNLMNDLGFVITSSTITRVRKENLSLIRSKVI